MAGENSLDFGIEATSEISGEDLLNSMDGITSNPDDIKKLDDDGEEDDTSKKPLAKKPLAKIKKKEEEEPEEEEDETILEKILNTKSSKKKEDEEPEDPKDDTSKEGEEDESEGDDNYISSISKELFKMGVFTIGEGEEVPEITTGEDLLNIFVNEKKKGAIEMLEGILSRHGEDKKELFDAIILKGVSPKEYLQKYTEIQDLRNVDLTDEGIQERVMREELKAQGWEKVDIDEEVDKIKSYGDLESASKRYHKSLIKRTESQLAADKTKKEQEAAFEADQQQEYLNNITGVLNAKLKDKEYDGIPITPALANKVLDSLYTKKWRTPSGETITDFDNEILRLKRPENHALKVKMGLLMELLKTDPTLSTIQRKAITKESNSLFSELEKKKIKKKETIAGKPSASVSSWFS